MIHRCLDQYQSGTKLRVRALMRIKSRDSIKFGGSPDKTLCISMLDFRRRSIITSGSSDSSDWQLNMRGQCSCYSKVYSPCRGQVRQSWPSHRRGRVPFRNQMLAALLAINGSNISSKEKRVGLPQRYSPIRGGEDHGTLEGQRRPKRAEQNPSPLKFRELIRVPCLTHNRTPLGLERDPRPL